MRFVTLSLVPPVGAPDVATVEHDFHVGRGSVARQRVKVERVHPRVGRREQPRGRVQGSPLIDGRPVVRHDGLLGVERLVSVGVERHDRGDEERRPVGRRDEIARVAAEGLGISALTSINIW